jgi:hypothetical protein
MSNQTVSTSPSEGETVLKLSDVVCVVINNPQFVDAIIPMVLDKVLEAMRPHVEKIVNDRLQPYIEAIWCFYVIKTQTRSSRVLFLFFYSRAQFVDFVCKMIYCLVLLLYNSFLC